MDEKEQEAYLRERCIAASGVQKFESVPQGTRGVLLEEVFRARRANLELSWALESMIALANALAVTLGHEQHCSCRELSRRCLEVLENNRNP